MSRHDELSAATDALFAAAERGDWPAFEAAFAPHARLRQNVGPELTLAQAMQALPRFTADGTTLRYDNVRRHVGDDHVTELHDAVFTKPDGRVVRIDICVVIEFDADGRIVRSDEYLDSAAASGLFA